MKSEAEMIAYKDAISKFYDPTAEGGYENRERRAIIQTLEWVLERKGENNGSETIK